MTIGNLPAGFTPPLDAQNRQWTLPWLAFLTAVAAFPSGYTVAGLPASAKYGTILYASNGRKPGESAGAGSGVLVYYDNASAWISIHSGVAVTA
jgi:hypothetical protein